MLDEIVADYPTFVGLEVASAIRHEIHRRHRRAVMTSRSVKVCPDCNVAKSHDSYRRDATRADGLDGFCRACRTTRTQGPCR